MSKIYESIALELWNETEYQNHTEDSVADVDGSVRLLCPSPSDIGRGFCGAHLYNLPIFVVEHGEVRIAVECGVCEDRGSIFKKYRSRRIGTLDWDRFH